MNEQPVTVLVIEDNPITRELVRVALATEGYEVLEAVDGRAAIELMERRTADLILQDLVLPDMHGLQLVTELRAVPGAANIPIIAMTGFLPKEEEARASAAGFSEYLIKPIDPSRLLETVRAYIGDPQANGDRSGTGKRVLVVDDDPIQLKLTRLHLARLGYEVQTACDGVDALTVAQRSPPDAILSDVLMPRLDGFKLCRTVRGDPLLRHIPVVLQSTHYADEADRALALRLGANACITRTPDLQTAAAALQTALAQAVPLPLDNLISTGYSEYQDRVVRLLERQASQNAELLQRSALQAAALEVLGSTAEALARRSPITDILQDTLYRCIDAAGLSVGIFYVLQPPATFVVHTAIGCRSSAGAPLESCFHHPELLERVLRSGAGLPIPSTELPEATATDFLDHLGLKACLLVPVSFREEPLGVLLLASNADDLGAREWLGFAQVISGQIGQAIALSRAFDELRVSEERYRLLFETNPLPAWVFDRETLQVLAVNDAAVRHYGYSRDEFLSLTIRDLWPQEDMASLEDHLRSIPAGSHLAGTWRHRKKNGSMITVEVSAHPIAFGGRGAELVVVHEALQ